MSSGLTGLATDAERRTTHPKGNSFDRPQDTFILTTSTPIDPRTGFQIFDALTCSAFSMNLERHQWFTNVTRTEPASENESSFATS